MLTDRQFVALQLFANITSKWPEVLFVERIKDRIKDSESIKRIADSSFVYADIFLEQSGGGNIDGNIDIETIETIEKEFKDIGDKLEKMHESSQKMNELNQELVQINKALFDLVTNDVEYVEEEVEEQKTSFITLGAIAWVDGEPVYVEAE
ncbi:hypothetical protein PL8927_510004 [Planktothrix serta PCC 8927]|uniref:Uncharacterized protein n=1 Tax=Planktothrix serta PCC 8927 TaxID=671068 RepID=A0A7Z9BMM8_9CYAN|nr:hypothetical protein [Planktothrix serta]VXD15965.1 hypothetical protein PL8927_510004 [Planktothrix serta PCC 8927]